MSLFIKNLDRLDQSIVNVTTFLQNRTTATEHDICTHLGISHKQAWTALRNLEMNAWAAHSGHEYYLTKRVGILNIYDPASERLIGRSARLILVAIKDYGPISMMEARNLTGVTHGATTRHAPWLHKLGLVEQNVAGLWGIASGALQEAPPLSLWPYRENVDKLANFMKCAEPLLPSTVILFDKSVGVITEALNAEDIYEFGQTLLDCMNRCEIKSYTLLIASKHSWLNEIHRIHYPPALKLREAMLGLPILGEKPKPNLVEVYKISTSFAPLTPTDIKQWTRKRWLTQTDTGEIAYTQKGIKITRKLRAATKVFHERITTPPGPSMDIFFA